MMCLLRAYTSKRRGGLQYGTERGVNMLFGMIRACLKMAEAISLARFHVLLEIVLVSEWEPQYLLAKTCPYIMSGFEHALSAETLSVG